MEPPKGAKNHGGCIQEVDFDSGWGPAPLEGVGRRYVARDLCAHMDSKKRQLTSNMLYHTEVACGSEWETNPNEYFDAPSNFASSDARFCEKYLLKHLTRNHMGSLDPVAVTYTDNLETACHWVSTNVLQAAKPMLGLDIEWRCVCCAMSGVDCTTLWGRMHVHIGAMDQEPGVCA